RGSRARPCPPPGDTTTPSATVSSTPSRRSPGCGGAGGRIRPRPCSPRPGPSPSPPAPVPGVPWPPPPSPWVLSSSSASVSRDPPAPGRVVTDPATTPLRLLVPLERLDGGAVTPDQGGRAIQPRARGETVDGPSVDGDRRAAGAE